MSNKHCTKSDRNSFYKFLRLLYGRHTNVNDYVFLLERLPFSDGEYANTTQVAKQLNLERIVNYILYNSQHDYFISPAIHSSDSRYAENITGLYAFYCEFDYGQDGHKNKNQPFRNKEECKTAIQMRYAEKGIMPTVVFASGHGIHCYWVTQENIVAHKKQYEIEQINEYLFQIGIGWNHEYFNEVKSINSMLRTCFPTVNRKIASKPVLTKIKFTEMEYSVQTVANVSAVCFEENKGRFIKQKKDKSNYICRIGDIELIENDSTFCQWISDSSDLCYFQNDKYEFDSTSGKEAWIFKYLYLCGLEAAEIYEFCCQYMDRQYHIYKRKTVSDRIKRIQYEIDKAIYANSFQRIRKEHINQIKWI